MGNTITGSMRLIQNIETVFEGPITRVPLEVLHHIMDQLVVRNEHRPLVCDPELPWYDLEEANAKATFAACSLVSRRFRTVSLPHLFHTVAFWIPGCDCSPEEAVFKGCRTLGTFRTFVDASPSIRRCVRDLRIGSCELPNPGGPRFEFVEFLGLLHRLPKLRSVELDIAFWSIPQGLDTLPQLGYPVYLDQFIIVGGSETYENVGAVTSAHLALVLKQLGGIGTIRFREVAFLNIDFPFPSALREPFPVSALVFEECLYAENFIADFDDGSKLAFSPTDLKELEICCLRGAISQVAHTLSVFGTGLETFRLHLQSSLEDEPWFDDPIDLGLQSCPALQDLTLIWDYGEVRPGSGPTPLCSILSSLRDHKDLHAVNIWVKVTANNPCEIWLDPDFMRAVEDELLQLKSVQEVTLDFHVQPWCYERVYGECPVVEFPEYDHFIERYPPVVFPRLFAKGVLRLQSEQADNQRPSNIRR